MRKYVHKYKSRMWIAGLVLTVGGCFTETVDQGETEAVNLALESESHGALRLVGCQDVDGKRLACISGQRSLAHYPNPLECESLKVVVQRNGKTFSRCTQADGSHHVIRDKGQTVPFLCRSGQKLSCLKCMDIFGSTIFDNCSDDAQDHQDEVIEEPSPSEEETPTESTDATECTPQQAIDRFSQELNRVLAEYGIQKTYQSDYTNIEKAQTRFDHGFHVDMCVTTGMKVLGYQSISRPMCQINEWTGRKTCRCAFLSALAAEAACEQMSTSCELGAWQMAIFLEMGDADNALARRTYLRASPDPCAEICEAFCLEIADVPDDSVQPPQDCVCDCEADDETEGDDTQPDDEDIDCSGSPLVLDLSGNGLSPTSNQTGVRFDLFNHGKVQTSWIQGDDALLAIDRNQNGTIDNGSELFGEGLNLDNQRSENGFSALSLVDDRRHGGNADGIVNSADKFFSELRVWNDFNTDGISQPNELRNLGLVGIKSLQLESTYTQGLLDIHGNDLGLRGSYQRTDGSMGEMVDIFFRFQPSPQTLLSRK